MATPCVAAIILAAGQSSRMGEPKALLPLAGRTALARVVGALRSAGIERIVTVTGYHARSVGPAATALGVKTAHNAEPERGMFSSVRTGAAALAVGGDSSPCAQAAWTANRGLGFDAFLVLPVDYPLVRASTLKNVIDAYASDDHDVVHPCCAGLRGHPPLLAARVLETLVASPDTDLRSFLEVHAPRAIEVEVDDLTVLLDMDTPDDRARLQRLALMLDSGDTMHTSEPHAPAKGLDPEDALFLLDLLRAPANVAAHCREVARVGKHVATALKGALPGLDVDLVHTACLLHDMVRGQGARRHAQMGERILRNLGAPRLAEVVGAHMVLPLDPCSASTITEEELVYLADKVVVEDTVAGLVGREQRALARCGDDAASRSSIRARMLVAELIAAKVKGLLGRSFEDLLAELPGQV
jgi:CTP:molybdopterin cytidylyltransferase MocA